ncbi:metallophosphoesterase [Flavobacterium sp.]|uniref:metallophosphoesterase n=1 Tax=Flavobacterium sp. TaxID=239 RepID=UPI0039E3ECEA
MTAKLPITILKYVLIGLIFQSCATNYSQFGSKKPSIVSDDFDNLKTHSHSFYLIGDAGNANEENAKKLFAMLEQRLAKADSSSTLIFLGDNVYPAGMPNKGSSFRKEAEEKLNLQLALSKKFKGKTIFIPGNHDWYNGAEGLKEQEKYVNDYLKKKKSFLPRKNCGIDHVDINDDVALIVIDSEWYLEDWDDHPTINEDCDIKTREAFFLELESEINKNQKKTTIIAMHHPLMSSGPHGGQYSLEKQIFPFKKKIPLPVIGTIVNVLRKTTGVSPQDLQNRKYNAFIKRVKTLIQDKSNVIVVSGHEHNLQYIDNENIKQVVSGSGSKMEAARAINPNDFSFGRNGYAVLDVLKSGASKVSFYGIDSKGQEGLLFKAQPLFARPVPNLKSFPNKFAASKDTAIYTAKMTTKGAAYRFLWGNHYRRYYSMPIRAKVVSLDTIYGGLKPTIAGGGHQSLSLRLADKNGKEYVMRALKKSATRFIQSVDAFKDQSVEKAFRDTYAENFIMDFYTTSHPYTPFVVGKLADKVGVNHTNPMLYYIPKQNTLGLFNEDFGNELYLVEERPTDDWKDLPSFGKPQKIVGTDDVLANLNADEKYEVDEQTYIRARMFDMLIGDWDRHQDQWRWSEYKENGKVIYRPIPRDRDQAFTKYDGNLLLLLMKMPPLRHMKKFNADLKNVKWFNKAAHNLDLAFVTKAEEKDWVKQAQYIVDNLSDDAIDKAFESLPKEVKDKTVDKIKSQLKTRKTHLTRYAREYYKIMMKTVLLAGTEKKDKFVVTRIGDATQVQVYRMKKEGEELIHDRTYHCPQTKEIWLYGLNDEDFFEVKGSGSKKIKIRLMGGQDNDTYYVSSGQKVNIYDFKSKTNTINNPGHAKEMLSDKYEINNYDYKKPAYNVFAGYPLIGANPDDGMKVGGIINYTVNDFNRFPYSQKHTFRGNYYFATNGFELAYKGTFPHVIGKWNFIVDALYTSPNFSVNYFGMGNETPNDDKDRGKDYNRVKVRTLRVTPAAQWIGEIGGSFTTKLSFERMQIDNTPWRYVTSGVVNPDVFDYKMFADVNAEYSFENYDNVSNPTLGITFSMLGGFKMNVEETERRFPYAEAALGFNYRISSDGTLVLATIARGKALFDDQYEFYQAPTVGGDMDLRGFRNQRFSGKHTFYQSTDLRYNLGKLKNGFVPMSYGFFGGFDYGRVWLEDDFSDKWHQSVGGGLWLNGVNLITAKLSYFQSSDGGRLSFGLGFGF